MDVQTDLQYAPLNLKDTAGASQLRFRLLQLSHRSNDMMGTMLGTPPWFDWPRATGEHEIMH